MLLQVIWDFIQKELLGMSWLNRVIGSLLELFGLDITSRVGGSVQFFLYDTIKIMVLLGFLILIISYIVSSQVKCTFFRQKVHTFEEGISPQECQFSQ